MIKRMTITAVGACLLASPAFAKQEYAGYEGPDAIQTGTGGAKTTKNGIDYWTAGSPPRRYQVLGILTDKRKDRIQDGSVVGSGSVAKIAKKAGGDAVIIGPADSQTVGVATNFFANIAGSNAYGSGGGKIVNRTTTQIVVVRYLPPE